MSSKEYAITAVSVIIPVYNAERYISECIDSLLAQTLHQCEFIFVNDGSTDRSSLIIEGYMNNDARITLITQQNEGVSAARNKGIEVASGEYFGFIDADDRVEPNMFENLYTAASADKCDVIFSNYESEQDGKKVISSCHLPINVVLNKAYIQKDILPIYLMSDHLNSVCSKIYAADLIRKQGLQFPVGVALGEDGLFNMEVLSHSNRVKYIDYAGYYYREVPGSATRNVVHKDYFERALEVYEAKLPQAYESLLEQDNVLALKTVKFIRAVISNIHIYYTPATGLSFKQKYKYVKKMVDQSVIHEALPRYKQQIGIELGKYEALILLMMKYKSAMGLYWITAYSRARNKQTTTGG